jgi:5-formyltetrahydrofolate cyclo-ligase
MLGKQTMRRQADSERLLCPAINLFTAVSPRLAEARRVASYLGSGNEPFVPPQPGWLLPVLLEDDDLDWAEYDGQLAPGRRGLLEPVGPRLGALARATGLTVALLHDGELVDEVPHEAHDVPVRAVATAALGLVVLA